MSSPFFMSSFLFAQAQPPAAQPTTSEQRSTSFRSVQGGEVLQSGEKLLVEAYAAIWLLLFAMLLLSWRRQKAMDERIASLEQAVSAARSGASAGKAGKKPSGEEAL